MKTSAKFVETTQGEALGVAGGNYRILLSGAETDGKYAVVEMTVPPGGGPPPHEHPLTSETFYILEGEFRFSTIEGDRFAGEGELVSIPLNGPVHHFRNVSRKMAKLLCTVVPAGLEDVFRVIGTPVAPGEFLPIPELTKERLELLEAVDRKFRQTTYSQDYFEKKRNKG